MTVEQLRGYFPALDRKVYGKKLVYLDFGTLNKPDVVHFTGTNVGMVISNTGVHHLEF